MKDVFARLGADFFSTIVFLAIYLATDNVLLATGVAIAGAIAQVIYSRIKGKELGYMTWASLALVIVLGSATLLTHDPRFVLAKPAIGHFAIGAIMLKRGWMLRYLPPIVTETIPEYVTFAGYAWAALMFVLGAGTIGVAMTGDMKLWTFYVTVVLVGAKIAAFAIQYVAFRILVGSRLRAAARAPEQYASKGRLRRLGLCGEIGYTADRVWRDLANHSGLPGRNVGETKMAVDGNWNITMSTPMGERKATLTLLSLRRHADGHAGRRRQFHRNLRRRHQRRRRQLEGLDHQPDAADPRVHRQGLRRQHVRRNGHRPDGQLPVHRDAGVSPMARRPCASSFLIHAQDDFAFDRRSRLAGGRGDRANAGLPVSNQICIASAAGIARRRSLPERSRRHRARQSPRRRHQARRRIWRRYRRARRSAICRYP